MHTKDERDLDRDATPPGIEERLSNGPRITQAQLDALPEGDPVPELDCLKTVEDLERFSAECGDFGDFIENLSRELEGHR